MKNILKRVIPAALIALVLTVSFIFNAPLSAARAAEGAMPALTAEELTTGAQPTAAEEAKTTYSILNNYAYRLAEKFTRSPDTFEAWVKMPVGSLGGTLFSNFYIENKMFSGTAQWSVDAVGRIKIYWDNGSLTYTFDNQSIGDGQWHHVALVRDPSADTFTLYIDGELEDSIVSRQSSLYAGAFPMSIGVDYQTFYTEKDPFEGYIRQVTVYNGAISQERVRQDMLTEEITDDYNGQIMGNWYLGDEWTERTVHDSTDNGIDAVLHTTMKYVGDATTDFEYDYSFVEIPDIQCTVRYKYSNFVQQMNWLAENGERLNVKWATFLGDLSDVGTNEQFYRQASIGMSLLDGRVNYNFVPGNHDYDSNGKGDRTQNYFDRWFPYDKFSKTEGFGGTYEEGSMANSYYFYNACGVDYLIIDLEYNPRMSVIRWAGRLCEAYPKHRVIIATHHYVEADGSISTTMWGTATWKQLAKVTEPQKLFDNLIKLYPNIFMVFSGHISQDDIIMRTDVGVHGNTIYSFLLDTQTAICDNGIGEDIMCIIKVNEKTRQMCMYYYSPVHDGVYNIQNQFVIPFPEGCSV